MTLRLPFEFEIDFRKHDDELWLLAVSALVIAALIGMAQIGRGVTPLDQAGNPQLLSWPDWRLLQAERQHSAELSNLRSDASQLAAMLDARPDPVVAQLLAEAIARDTRSGDPSLADARQALLNAALDVRDWTTGTLDRDTAVQSVQTAFTLLQ